MPRTGAGAHAGSETAWKIAERLRGPLGVITYRCTAADRVMSKATFRAGAGDAAAGYHGRLLRFFHSIGSRGV